MRIRTIKPEFWESESLSRVSREARLLFVGLFSCCDDHGRTRAHSRILASRLYPFDDDALSLIEGWLSELSAIGSVRLYEVEGERFLDIPKWLNHQKIDRPSKSKFPEFDESSRVLAKCSLGTGNREQGQEQGTGMQGGCARVRVVKVSEPTNLIIPASLNSQNFLTAWADWVEFRKSRNKVKNWNKLFQKTLDWLASHPVATSVAIIDQSLRNGWIGLFDLKVDPRAKPSAAPGGVNHVLINAENWEKQEEHRERVRAERERTAQVSAELDRKIKELEEQP